MNGIKSFDRTEYSNPEIGYVEAYQVIRQIMTEITNDRPTVGMWVDMTGNQLRVHYHKYEMLLPTHMRETVGDADVAFKNLIKHIKSEFKTRTGKTLKLVEKKDLENYTVEKVSLNERYYYKAWRVFEVRF